MIRRIGSDLSRFEIRTLGNLQAWLQGWPEGNRGRVSVSVGNALSTVRYWTWRAFTAITPTK